MIAAARESLERLERLRDCTLQASCMIAADAWCLPPVIGHWSSVGWQFGHIATFEQAFVLERLKGDRPLFEALKLLFMPATALPPERIAVPPRDDLLDYVADIRARTREYVGNAAPTAALEFTLKMLVEHESMHLEHLLHMACWLDPVHLGHVAGPMALAPAAGDGTCAGGPDTASRREDRPVVGIAAGSVRIPAGSTRIGRQLDPDGLWDNEHPAHERWIDTFELDRCPVTNGDYLAFVEAGGYHSRRWWSDAGWGALELLGALHPYYWRSEGDTWRLRRLFGEVDLPVGEPVMGLSWFEAEAFARWSGRRLPTEFEWERAARWAAREAGQPESGLAPGNHGFRHDGPAPAGVSGASPGDRLIALFGNVWEWTDSWFEAYPGFQAGPYERYSAPQFGQVYRVLKGGCWATLPELCRPSFRNWYNPYLRPIFAGVRLAGPTS